MGVERPAVLDVGGGADPALDEVTATIPESAAYREGVSIWLWDDAGRFCFPRIGVEAVGATWSSSFEIAICMATPDGRLLLANADESSRPVQNTHGQPRTLGTGSLSFDCLEPFKRWRVTFQGRVVVTDVGAYLAGGVPKLRTGAGLDEAPLRLVVDADMVVPPWFQGTREPHGRHVAGERRFEQLCTVTGLVEVGGAVTRFVGGGLRVHRKGGDRNEYGDFHGHSWQSARFPSGRAFGYIHYHPGPDGAPRYSEGWLFDGTELLPARVEVTPWLLDVQPSGEDVSVTLRTARGETCIGGMTFASSFRPPRSTTPGTTFPVLQSGIARYRWDAEETYGMVERSSRLEVST